MSWESQESLQDQIKFEVKMRRAPIEAKVGVKRANRRPAILKTPDKGVNPIRLMFSIVISY
jgi:hypothetical protein